MKSLSISRRNDTIYILPKVGLADVGPVFTAGIDQGEVAAALDGAIAAIPVDHVMPAPANDYRSPLLDAMKVRSAVAYERGLKSAVLRFGDDGYKFYRYVPHQLFKTGFRREDKSSVHGADRHAALGCCGEGSASLEDPTWPMKRSQLPRSRRH